MKIKAFVNHILKRYPLDCQEKWDESGLLSFFDQGQDITSCVICLDITENVVDQALRQNAQIIISHHPIFQKNPDHPINKKEQTIIKRLQDNQISCLCLHTCYDNNKKGMNVVLAQILGFKNFHWFKNDINNEFIMIDLPCGMSVKQIANVFKTKVKHCQMFITNINDDSRLFRHLAICAGSGYDVLSKTFDGNLDSSATLFITGDLKYHNWSTINQFSLCFLDVGHEVENIFVDTIDQYLKQRFHNIRITKIYSEVKKYVI